MICSGNCSLEKEPWRWNFSGENCACGIATPGDAKERESHEKNKRAKSKSIKEQVDLGSDKPRNAIINELYTKNGLLND